MNHLINSYGLFLVFFVSMFVLIGLIEYLGRRFNLGFIRVFSQEYSRDSLSVEYDGKSLEQLEKRVADLEAEIKARKNHA